MVGERGAFFFFKQKTAYEIGTGDWSSDVCSSDLVNEIDIAGEDSSDVSAFRSYLNWANQTFEAQHWEIGRASCRERV